MESFEEEVLKQQTATGARVADRHEERRRKINILGQPGGIAKADDPKRVATRIDRLSRYHHDIRPINPAAVVAEEPAAMAAAGAILERVIKTEDFLGVGYLEGGVIAARGVGRVNIRDPLGRLLGYGTGSMVSPDLLLTNHHVLPDADTASASTIEFNYQDGPDGQPLEVKSFGFDTERFFLTETELDFTLVAVKGTDAALSSFGHNRLIEAEGKAIVGDFVTIVQHPSGEKKQIALRENRIVDLLENFLHYETDTEPGSSGSPVFNDQWEIVALHHASVPAPDHTELGGIVNEGIRVSRLMQHIRAQDLLPAQKALVDLLAQPEQMTVGPNQTKEASTVTTVVGQLSSQPTEIALPLQVFLRVGNPVSAPPLAASAQEAISIDPDYESRAGYDPDFLGKGKHAVPLPTLAEGLIDQAAVNQLATSEPNYVLPYHHFSVVLNKQRRLAFFTAVNIDGSSSLRLKREKDRWFFDPRLAEDEQTGEEVYRDNPLDRGHLVRRLDPAWGATRAIAKLSNDDTFHFTNCTPQHEDFNQNKTSWAGLEDYILDNADNQDFKVSVFSGPVLAEDDDEYKGVQLPRQFWKVVAMIKQGGELSATGYLLSQEQLIKDLEILPEAFSYGAYRTYQVPVSKIEKLTRLSFGSLPNNDPLEIHEATGIFKEVDRREDIQL